MYRVKLTSTARKAYKRVDQRTAERLDYGFKALERNPFDFAHYDIKKLHGRFQGLFRYCVGDLRIIYRVDKDQKVVEVVAIKTRAQAYC